MIPISLHVDPEISIRGRFGDPLIFRVGDHFEVGVISGAVDQVL